MIPKEKKDERIATQQGCHEIQMLVSM